MLPKHPAHPVLYPRFVGEGSASVGWWHNLNGKRLLSLDHVSGEKEQSSRASFGHDGRNVEQKFEICKTKFSHANKCGHLIRSEPAWPFGALFLRVLQLRNARIDRRPWKTGS